MSADKNDDAAKELETIGLPLQRKIKQAHENLREYVLDELMESVYNGRPDDISGAAEHVLSLAAELRTLAAEHKRWHVGWKASLK